MRTSRPLVSTLMAFVAFLCLARPGGAGDLKSRLERCELPGSELEFLCGSLSVWENREVEAGRRIDLNLVLLPAAAPEPAPDPIVFLHGGPGLPATAAAPLFGPALRHLGRDFVAVDQRGTGRSNPLDCDTSDVRPEVRFAGNPEAWLLSPESVVACRQELERKADLRFYTTPAAMDDLDEVRRALGYERINLLGVSYGGTAALVYLRRHPERVRTMFLLYPDPPDL